MFSAVCVFVLFRYIQNQYAPNVSTMSCQHCVILLPFVCSRLHVQAVHCLLFSASQELPLVCVMESAMLSQVCTVQQTDISLLSDSVAAFLAAGVQQPGEAVSSLGSTLAIDLLSSSPIHAARYGICSYRWQKNWIVGEHLACSTHSCTA